MGKGEQDRSRDGEGASEKESPLERDPVERDGPAREDGHKARHSDGEAEKARGRESEKCETRVTTRRRTYKWIAVLMGDHPNSSCMMAENEI